MEYIKKVWPYIVAFVIFAAVACLYMSPVLDGMIIATSDGVQGRGAVHECAEFHEQTGEYSWWNGSMFSGMPNYQIGGSRYEATTWLAPFKSVLLWGHSNVIAIVLIYCLGFFILLRSMKIDKWLCIVGALAIAFSSYFFIIIGANHHSKTSTLALMSIALAGFYLIYNGHRRTGVCLTMIGTMAGFYPHPQMSYYLCWVIAAFGVAELYYAFVRKTWKDFAINSVLALMAFGIGFGTGTANTYSTLEYAEETMRGGHSDLVKESDATNKTKGLDLDYATAWSYGVDETWTLLVPDYMGGSSNYNVGKDSELCKEMVKKGVPRKSAEQFCESVPTYWGTQPFTSGPVYLGALVCLLFVLGLMIVKGAYKWALLVVTLLSIDLSWGHNWMWFTKLFFDYVPMYNKFRAVSSILVIAEITMPLLGFLAVQRIVEAKRNGTDLGRQVLVSGGIVVGLLLLCLMTTSGFAGMVDAQLPDWMQDMMISQREKMFRSDLFRSLGFVLAGTVVLWLYAHSKKFNSTGLLSLALGAIVLIDMWPVDKRYMNDSMFSPGNAFDKQFKPQAWETEIFKQENMDIKNQKVVTDNHFRVFNLAMNPFNDARTSYRLKSIGGYSAAKLRRYQDLIDKHLSQVHMPVINMLNARYIVVPDRNNGNAPMVQYNPEAMGNAWFVDELKVVDTPNEECDGLMSVDLRKTAIVGKDYASYVKPIEADSTAQVKLTVYAPNRVEYDAVCQQPGTVVFSEIFYPYGWKCTVDGQSTDIFRANYMLRAIHVPSGSHHISMVFDPDSVAKGNTLSMIFVFLLYAILLGCIGWGIYDWRKKA